MKYLAFAALTGAVRIESTNQEKLFARMKFVDEADAMLKENSNVQLDYVIEKADNWDGWGAHMHEFPGTVNEHGDFMSPYTRAIPERFQGNEAISGVGSTDLFTQNILKNYAIESKDDNHKPDGNFWITQETGLALAKEVACTHYKLCGDDATKYLSGVDNKYQAAWDYYDVNKAGKIDAVGQSGSMLRHLFRPLGWLDIQ